MDPFIGQTILFAGNFAPRGWALCEGQMLSINQYQALYSLLGTTYGGDGRTTFALPDLRGRAPVHKGTGPGLSPVSQGQKGGSPYTYLQVQNLPAHSHQFFAEGKVAEKQNPKGNLFAANEMYTAPIPANNKVLNSQSISPTGSGQAINNMPPFLALNYIIALEGVFPSRS